MGGERIESRKVHRSGRHYTVSIWIESNRIYLFIRGIIIVISFCSTHDRL
jgi:hypothetical protein